MCKIRVSIYECHIGMSGEDPCVSSYCSFEYSVLPRVIADGYNCVLLGTRCEIDPIYGYCGTCLLSLFWISVQSILCDFLPFRNTDRFYGSP